MSDLTNLTVQQALDTMKRGDRSSRELTQSCLDRIERLEPSLHAFITLTPELALKQADDADKRWVA